MLGATYLGGQKPSPRGYLFSTSHMSSVMVSEFSILRVSLPKCGLRRHRNPSSIAMQLFMNQIRRNHSTVKNTRDRPLRMSCHVDLPSVATC